MRTLAAFGCALVFAAAVVYAQNPMRAGRWDVAVQMQMVGMQMPEMKSTQCITEDQLQQDPASGLPNAVQNGTNDTCKVSDYKVAGNRVTWKMACSGRESMTGDGDLTFSGDSYAGTINVQTREASMAMKMTGKRVGDCTR